MRWLLIISFVFISVFGFGQSIPKLLEIADGLFENHRYLEASEFYRKISRIDRKNYQAKYRLGYCYLQSLAYEEAKEVFSSLGTTSDQANDFRAKSLYHYASLIKLESNFSAADSLFSFLISLPDAESDLISLSRKQKEGCILAMRQQKIDKGFTAQLVEGINSKFHDFGAVINPGNKQMVFATARNLRGGQYAGSQYDGVLPDLASFERKGNRWKNASSDQRFVQINTEWSEGSGCFTKDGKTFYFSSCKGSDGSDCAIMVTYLVDDRWTSPEALNEYINEAGSENKQPSLSVTGDTLFFSSDRPGGFGGSDIWMSLKGLEAESWTPAINMGDVINSPENDITPYYSSAFSCLLFASNGHVGYGGYDLYAAKGESFFEPEIYNLGHPFNSTIDDTYFSISDTVGFLSSNREDGKNLNLYSFPVSGERLFLSLLISGESLIDSRVASRFRDIRSIDLFTFRVEDYQGYELYDPVKRDKPKPAIIRGEEEAEEESIIVAVDHSKVDHVVYHPENNYANTFISGVASNTTNFETVYFDHGSYQLKPLGKLALKSLAEQLKGFPVRSIDVLAYTDNVGTSEYNMGLSERRGTAVRTYLASLGVPEENVRVLARGEGPLTSRNSWYAKMFSRRAEIIVNADEPIQLRKARTYAVRYESKVDLIASQLGLTVNDLKIWNDFKTDTIKSGELIRVGEELGVVPNIKYYLEEKDIRNTFFIYSVKEGETLQTIARKYNTPEELLLEVNDLNDSLNAGDEIFIYRMN